MNIYQENILDHYHNPRNFGTLKDASNSLSLDNPSCGDSLSLSLIIEKNTISQIVFMGSGCALSIAGASLLIEYVKGKNVEEMTQFSGDDMLKLLGIDIGPARLKCALLSWEALQKILVQFSSQEKKM
ncbi:MAG: iron-sulfur cluster assembly scaffold protein [Candidatus Moranbacteria bacterium]|nr:iron-sulfur cluster assembly scaffold protein [Candidatus Moranbacteria bacterium]